MIAQRNGIVVDVDADEPPVEVKKQLLEQEIIMWVNTRYQAQIRYKVHKKLGIKTQQAEIVKELEQCEKALDLLRQELAALVVMEQNDD